MLARRIFNITPSCRRFGFSSLGLLGGASLFVLGSLTPAQAQVPAVLNVCGAPGVTLPVLTPITGGLVDPITGVVLNPLLGDLIGNIDLNLTQALSGKALNVTVLDNQGNLISAPADGCSITTNNANGIQIGGGQIDGLGAGATASAGAASAIAFGNGATTAGGSENAIAVGTGANANGTGATALGAGASAGGTAGNPAADEATALGTNANASVAGGVALGANSVADRANAPAEMFTGEANPAVGAVSVGAAGAERQITNVAGGTAPTDAVNVRQLRSVGTALSSALGAGAGFDAATGAFAPPNFAVGGNTYNTVSDAIAALQTGPNPIGPGLVTQDTPTSPILVGAATAGDTVNVAGTAGPRIVTGVAAGTVGAGSTDAVNGAQLAAVDAGAVKYDRNQDGTPNYSSVTLGNVPGTGPTLLANVAEGQVAAGSTQAVNGSQLFTTNTGLGNAVALFGAGATYDPATGAVTLPAYSVYGTTYNDVGAAIAALQASGNGPGVPNSLVTQATPTSPILVGATTGGTSVNFTGTDGARTLTGVAAGAVGAGSTDAVNGAQLAATQAGVTGNTNAIGAGAAFDPVTGAYTAPSFTVQGNTYNNVGSAVAALDSSGVKYDIDPATGGRGNTVTLAGGDPNTPVIVRNVGAGILNTDAANVGQVRASQAASMAYTDQRAAQTLQDARTYTDQAIANANFGNDVAFARLNQEIGQVRREARQAAAVGLAASSLRYDDRPGKISLAAGAGSWRGEGAASVGLGYTSPDGFARVNVGATTTGAQWGVSAGLSLTLN